VQEELLSSDLGGGTVHGDDWGREGRLVDVAVLLTVTHGDLTILLYGVLSLWIWKM
jgi:hypothetical protein